MIRALFPAALLATTMGGPAFAQDPRLVERLYDPAEVVQIEGKVDVQAMIRFAEDELIENVAIGDSRAWQVTPNKRANLLFIKPLAEHATTNMTVVTDKRTYYFDLVANPKARPFYALDFEYLPDPREQARSDETSRRASPVGLAAANGPYELVHPETLNLEWRAKGDKKLLPRQIYDDGEATFLIWPAGEPLPAILVKNEAGIEGPVNFAVRGDVIVIDGVPRELVLRSGKDMATLENKGPQRPRSALARLEEVQP